MKEHTNIMYAPRHNTEKTPQLGQSNQQAAVAETFRQT